MFDQVRAALLRPEILLAGEGAIAATSPVPDDEVPATELARLTRKSEAAKAERRRLADLYHARVTRPVRDPAAQPGCRRSPPELVERQERLMAERHQLVADNELRRRVGNFARRIATGIDELDFRQHQQLIRLVVDEVRVHEWASTAPVAG